MDFSKMRTPDWILGGCALVLVISLLFFPWHRIDLGPFGSATRSGVQSPNAFWGILALILAAAVVVVVVARRLTTAKLPDLPISWSDALLYGSIATLVVLLIKLVSETDFLGWGAWISLLLAAGMIYGAFAARQEDAKELSTAGPASV